MRAEVRVIIEKKPTHRQRAGHSRPSARTFRSRFSLFISASCASFSWRDPLVRWPPFLRAEAALNISGIAKAAAVASRQATPRSEEHTSELQSLMRISYAVFCLKKKKKHIIYNLIHGVQYI